MITGCEMTGLIDNAITSIWCGVGRIDNNRNNSH